MWGSNWTITMLMGVNPFFQSELVEPVVEPLLLNPGGANGSTGVNPLVRIRPPQSDALPVSLDTNEALLAADLSDSTASSESELIYATEPFDRQRQAIQSSADSRWRDRRQRHVRVPVLDVMLVVAFQKILRKEELEFLVLLLAIDDECVA